MIVRRYGEYGDNGKIYQWYMSNRNKDMKFIKRYIPYLIKEKL